MNILINLNQLEVFSNNNIEKVQQYDMNSVAKEYINYYEIIKTKLL